MTQKPKLELVWPTKYERARPEPRILIDKQEYFSDKPGINDNLLIHGDNLLGLKALEREYAGKIKCIYIDPPYNTKSCFTHYDDSMEHSMWLDMMRDRLLIMHRLLSGNGSIWITIDDCESHYLKIMCDEIFGRNCFIASIAWRTTDNSNNNAKKFSSDHNYILVYSKKVGWVPNFLQDEKKRTHFKNPDNDPRGPWYDGNPVNNPALRPNLQYDLISPNGTVIKSPPNGWRWSKDTIQEKIKIGEIRFSADEERIIRRTYLHEMAEGLPPSNLWFDLDETGHNRQAKYELKNLFPNVKVTDLFETPKPERLIKKILDLATKPGDIVLDSFAGSGTTGAVAHKMGRRWIMIEMGEHAKTHIIPRLKKVIDGDDLGGITQSVNWQGGGGFKFSGIAPSLLKKDSLDRWSINPTYTPKMLREAMCLHAGFSLSKDNEPWWCHGQSTQQDFIYVTPETLTRTQLAHLSQEVGPNRSLLIFCGAFTCKEDEFENLKIEKIPKSVMTKCDWDNDDYSLKNSPKPGGSKTTSIQKHIRLKAAAKSVSSRRKK